MKEKIDFIESFYYCTLVMFVLDEISPGSCDLYLKQ